MYLIWHDLSPLQWKNQNPSSGNQLDSAVWRNDKRISPFWEKATFINFELDFWDCPQRKASWTFIVQKWSFQKISIIKFVFLSNIFEQKNEVRPKYSFHELVSYEQKNPASDQ